MVTLKELKRMAAIEAKQAGLLIIDDDEQIRSLLYSILAGEYDCTLVSSAEAALSLLKNIKFDLVISDINMGGISGLDLVPFVLQQSPETVVVMVSGQHRIDAAIQAMRAGAFDYLTKPFDIQHVEAAMQRALAHHRLLEEKKYYQDSLQELLSCRTAEVEQLAYFDSLTDLPNRLLFEDRLTQALKHARQDNQPVGNVLMRIDRFKEITDTLGPATGNRLLREIAWRVRKASHQRGTAARFEGDNFASLITDIHSSEDVLEVLKDLIESLRVPFVLDDHRLHVTASIGVSLFPVDGETSEELLKNAGIALFRAESVGGDNYQFYQAEMNARALELLKMEGDLRRAIEADELRLYYQPQVDLRTHQIVGVEALVRWQHPELGLLQPSRFIPLAEDTGLIAPLGEWGLREACRQLVLWQQDGLDALRISVNVSPCQFQQKNFVETVAQILLEAEIDPAKLQLEITETSLMNSADEVITRLTELKQMGLMIAIDDFGVGYSSLGYLKRLPIDMLKIDRSFVNDATTDPDDAALIMAIITLAHNLRLKVMAEGVETNDQVRFLGLLRCDEAQGYLFGKAEPGEFFNAQTIGTTANTALPGSRQSTINQDRELLRVVK
ncbi:MAG TPA: EAL domain-containing protein [Pyrinomonadaceae bacterium]|jgi:diguanylate cyclase (GGDEF)-like protein|nr:EAL domain-containing protein [Pyrinomonadaceae bacterium]